MRVCVYVFVYCLIMANTGFICWYGHSVIQVDGMPLLLYCIDTDLGFYELKYMEKKQRRERKRERKKSILTLELKTRTRRIVVTFPLSLVEDLNHYAYSLGR